MTIDLKLLDPTPAHDKGFELELKHPTTGKGVKAYITVSGEEGTAYRKYMEAVVDAQIAENYEGSKAKPTTLAKEIARAVEKCVACTIGWREIAWEGAELPFTPENARMLYQHKFIRGQVLEAIENAQNFTAG